MSYQGDDKARFRRQATRQAITLAMESRWEEAGVVNRGIIESFPTDVDAHNRLGRALTELGEYAQAREAYRRALALDPHNAIAQKNLSRLSILREEVPARHRPRHQVVPHIFGEEKGKTGLVFLENLGTPEALAKMVAGDEISLRVEGQRLIVEDRQGEYLGQVEPRHAARLIKLMAVGNRYTAAIASPGPEAVKVVIQETYQHPSQAGRLSFPVKETEPFRSYIRDSVIKYELEDEEESFALEEEGEYLPEVEEAPEEGIALAEGQALEPEEEEGLP